MDLITQQTTGVITNAVWCLALLFFSMLFLKTTKTIDSEDAHTKGIAALISIGCFLGAIGCLVTVLIWIFAPEYYLSQGD